MTDQSPISRFDADAAALMARVGAHVRAARDARKIPRRALSDMSSVSPRYLAQLVDDADVIALYRAASPSLHAEVRRLLTGGATQVDRAHHVCLVDLRGVGKSTLGVRVGHRLDVPFVELNREIERASGMPVKGVMALDGQEV